MRGGNVCLLLCVCFVTTHVVEMTLSGIWWHVCNLLVRGGGEISLWNLGVTGDIIGAMDVAIGKPRSYSILADGLGSEQ